MKKQFMASRMMMIYGRLLVMTLLMSCNQNTSMFQLVGNSGIEFTNQLVENDSMNILDLEYFYRGGGVAIADVNNDHLPDVILGGNMVPTRLYLNQGDFKFKDISEKSGFRVTKWVNGISLADINKDGFLDIYLCVGGSNNPDLRENQFFVSESVDKNGIPNYQNKAIEYGVASNRSSTQAAFFDYDLDNDLDIMLVNTDASNKNPNVVRIKINDGSAGNTDQLFENQLGKTGKFINVSDSAGIIYEGFSLGLSVTDINHDGWPDVYVANDHISNDVFYINQGNKTFENQIDQILQNQSFYSMGVLSKDFDNNGLSDILTLDMMPETNERKQKMMMAMNISRFKMAEDYNYQRQFMRNALHVHKGFTQSGKPIFSEQAQFSGIHNTDWSWGSVAADFDLDGDNDIIVANGYARDITNLDFVYYQKTMGYFDEFLEDPDYKNKVNNQPPIYLSNYAFSNVGNSKFEDISREWGLLESNLSNGIAYGDLDSDGDLDLVVNRLNSPALIYKNHAKSESNHYLKIIPFDHKGIFAYGSKAYVYSSDGLQFEELYPIQGYQSNQEPVLHFGLGEQKVIDSLVVIWPDRTAIKIAHPKIDTTYQLHQSKLSTYPATQQIPDQKSKIIFNLDNFQVDWRHEPPTPYKDFYNQPLIPQTYSKEAPQIAKADIDGNGLIDFYVCTGLEQEGQIFLQTATNQFSVAKMDKGGHFDDMDAEWIDLDQDGDLDLYVSSGGVSFMNGHKTLMDRLYLNTKQGFQLAQKQLPDLRSFTKDVISLDFDQDQDMDLLVFGRMVNGKFPSSPQSYLLQNEEGNFLDVSAQYLPNSGKLGMIASADQADLDGDGVEEIILAGEWQAIKILSWHLDHYELEPLNGFAHQKGWWQNVQVADINQDGAPDILAGNIGLNNVYAENLPLELFNVDLDKDGSPEPLIGWHIKNMDGEKDLYPLAQRDALIAQVPSLKRFYSDYEQFANVKIADLLKLGNEDYQEYKINFMESAIFINDGKANFDMISLPLEAQLGPVNKFIVEDFNQDQKPDILCMGNNEKLEVAMGWNNNFLGAFLINDETFEAVDNYDCNLFLKSQIRDAVKINDQSLLLANYADSLQVLSWEYTPDSRHLDESF
ncbi:MAG: VCBS repeat-containing protein [Candidatus Cyclobacteriaceae bacterium M3_2C_046]